MELPQQSSKLVFVIDAPLMKVLTEDMDKVMSLPKLPEKRMYEKTFGEIGKIKKCLFKDLNLITSSREKH